MSVQRNKPGFNPGGVQYVPNPVTGAGYAPAQGGQFIYVPVGPAGIPGTVPFDVPGAGAGIGAPAMDINFGGNLDINIPDENTVDPKWYLSKEGELANVTADRTNPAIGVTDIKIFKPTANQRNVGILCKLQLVTAVATFNNISIMTSKFDDTAIRFVQPSHEGGNGSWFEDYKLADTVIAQALSYVDSLITKK